MISLHNSRDFNNNTPLDVAIRYGNAEMVELLLNHGAGIDPKPSIEFLDSEIERAEEERTSTSEQTLRKFKRVKDILMNRLFPTRFMYRQHSS